MRDLESLVQSTWNRDVRPFVEDALNCYNAGVYRSSIVAIWTAVCADILEKIMHLAEEGDARATVIAGQLEQARREAHTISGISLSQKIENSIIASAFDLELIDAASKEQLERLHRDRNLCAHPSLHAMGGFYVATAESARLHISVAADSLLMHGPTQGRRALDRFTQFVVDDGFRPSNEYIVNAFYKPCRSAARRALVDVAVKHALLEIDPGVTDMEVDVVELADRFGACVLAFGEVDRLDVLRALSKCQIHMAATLSEVKIRATARLGDLDIFWDSMLPSDITYLNDFIREADIDAIPPLLLSLIASSTAQSKLPALVERVAEIPPTHMALAIVLRPDPVFVPYAASLLRKAPSYRSSELILTNGILPLVQWFDLEILRDILEAWSQNSQCIEAGQMPSGAVSLFDRTIHLLPSTLVLWTEFLANVQRLATNDYYRYPTLEERINAHSD